jgi:hypothetical protein
MSSFSKNGVCTIGRTPRRGFGMGLAADDADERGSDKEIGTEGREGRKETEEWRYSMRFAPWSVN